ncbi:helix-turn-helix domain-containing protein [Streptomyces sp. NPDC057540]|uniref:helix-turn-helix domain-containing protein n=1 Tax=Streptomyces sp. NPDC057540 TaxID=3346160 RepID=UPI0036CD7A7D
MAALDLHRLAEYVRLRRTHLDLGVEPAARAAGISKDTWKRVENGLVVRDTKYAGIERVLQWAPGGCMAVARGREPLVSTPSDADPDVRITEIPDSELERAVGDAVRSAVVATRGDLTGDDILKLNAKVMEELRARGILKG